MQLNSLFEALTQTTDFQLKTMRDVNDDCGMQGRILVFAVKDFKLQLICEREVKGAVYNVNAFQVISLSLLACGLWGRSNLK